MALAIALSSLETTADAATAAAEAAEATAATAAAAPTDPTPAVESTPTTTDDSSSSGDAIAVAIANVEAALAAQASDDTPASESKTDSSMEPGSSAPEWLSKCVAVFRETLQLGVADSVDPPLSFPTILKNEMDDNAAFLAGSPRKSVADAVLALATQTASEAESEAEAAAETAAETAGAASADADADAANADLLEEERAEDSGLRLDIDTEMVTEQEQEKEMAVETVQEVEKMYAKPTDSLMQWAVSLLAAPLPSPLLSSVFHQLKDIQVSSAGPPAVAFPGSLLFSDNHAPLMHAADLPRRLRNVSVILEWFPPLSEPSYVLLSLDEAESLRRAIHTRHSSLGPHPSVFSIESIAHIALILPSGRRLDISHGVPPPDVSTDQEPSPLQLNLQAARFFNCDLWYSPTQLAALLRAVSDSDRALRKAFFEASHNCRRRDRGWENTSLAEVFVVANEIQLLYVLGLARRVREAVNQQHTSLAACFEAFDSNGDGWLSPTELQRGMESLHVPGLTAADIAQLIATCDRNSDGYLDLREFSTLFTEQGADAVLESSRVEDVTDGEGEDEDGEESKDHAGTGADADADADKTEADLEREVSSLMGAAGSMLRRQASQRSGIPVDAAAAATATAAAAAAAGSTGSPRRIARHVDVADVTWIGQAFVTSGGSAVVLDGNLMYARPGNYPSVSPRGVALMSGTHYYEVTVMKMGAGARAVIGFGTLHFAGNSRLGRGVGEGDDTSWGIDVATGSLLHNGKSTPLFHRPLEAGDVVRCMIDVPTGDMRFRVGGAVVELGAPDASAGPSIGFFPAVSFNDQCLLHVNFGKSPFRFTPPEPYTSVQRVAALVMEWKTVRDAGTSMGRWLATSGDSAILIDDDTVRAPRAMTFPSAALAGVLLTRGKWYYEITLQSSGLAQLGWGDVRFVGASKFGVGCGDDKSSWAFDGERVVTWSAGSQDWGRQWFQGDVLGLAADVDTGTLSFSLNGSFAMPMGVAFRNIAFVGGLAPAVTLQGGSATSLKLNLGQTPFKFAPPSDEYKSVASWVEEHKALLPVAHPADLTTSMPPPATLMQRGISTLHSPPLTADPSAAPSVTLRSATHGGHRQVYFTGSSRNSVTATGGLPSLVADGLSLKTGCWYYEVVVNSRGRAVIGWGSSSLFFGDWMAEKGVGDDAHSFGFEGSKPAAVMGGTRQYFGTRWSPGDIVGTGIDLDSREVMFFLNGAPIGVAFEGFDIGGGVTPALSLAKNTSVTVNFGPTFTMPPPGRFASVLEGKLLSSFD